MTSIAWRSREPINTTEPTDGTSNDTKLEINTSSVTTTSSDASGSTPIDIKTVTVNVTSDNIEKSIPDSKQSSPVIIASSKDIGEIFKNANIDIHTSLALALHHIVQSNFDEKGGMGIIKSTRDVIETLNNTNTVLDDQVIELTRQILMLINLSADQKEVMEECILQFNQIVGVKSGQCCLIT